MLLFSVINDTSKRYKYYIINISQKALIFNCYKILSNIKLVLAFSYLYIFLKSNYFITIFMFNSNYLPDRLDLCDVNSIAYHEFIESQKRSNNISFLTKVIKLIVKKGV